MTTRRLEKVSKVIRNTVSEVIQNELSDPRIKGLVSVTRVEAAADLRKARVYLSVLGLDDKGQQLCLAGIEHAAGHIQGRLARQMATKVCPTLTFFLDDSLKAGYRILRLIDEVSAEHLDLQEPAAEDDSGAAQEPDDEGQQ